MKLRAVITCAAVLASAGAVFSVAVAQAAPTRYEAEAAPATCDGAIASNHAGFSGSGFCDGRNAVGAAAQFTVSASASGPAELSVRFANGAADRSVDVVVNGATVAAATFETTGAWTTWTTKTLTLSVISGATTIRLNPTTTGGLPNVDYVEIEVTSREQSRYEAETSPATCDGTIDANYPGYSGTGFCNGRNAVGAAAQFTVNASAEGSASLTVRFANGTATARPADVVVNGAAGRSVSFDGTDSWSSWTTRSVTVPLNTGSNTIRFNPTTSNGLPNIDYLDLEVSGTTSPSPSPSASGMPGNGRPGDVNLQYYGRWNRSDPSYYSMGWAGGYVEARFTGSSIGVRQRRAIDLFYSVDGRPLQWRRNVSGNVTLATGLSGTSHTVRIGYRERAGSYNGDPVFGGLILASGGQTHPITRPQNFIEFIGDSITVGQPNANRPFTAYGWLAGDALGAGHTQVAQGGACLVNQNCVAMVDYFRRSNAFVSFDDWNFSTYQATAVVINLGTNDAGRSISGPTFQQNYVLILERVRRAYPNAHIFAMQTFRNRYVNETRNAVSARTAAGDSKVHFVDTVGWIGASGDLVDSVHPSDQGHRKIAQRLAPILDQYI